MSLLGRPVNLNDLSLRDAQRAMSYCKRVDLSDTDKFKIMQLTRAAKESGFTLNATGEVIKCM